MQLILFFFFQCGPFLKSVLNLLQYCFHFIYLFIYFESFFSFWLQGMWDLSSSTKDWTQSPSIGRQSLDHWTTREVPCNWFLNPYFKSFLEEGKGQSRQCNSSLFPSKQFLWVAIYLIWQSSEHIKDNQIYFCRPCGEWFWKCSVKVDLTLRISYKSAEPVSDKHYWWSSSLMLALINDKAFDSTQESDSVLPWRSCGPVW